MSSSTDRRDRQRLQSALTYLSPLEFETKILEAAATQPTAST